MPARDPDILVDLTDAPTPQAAELTRASLEAAGIPAFAFTAPGWMSPWEMGSTRPYRVQVRRSDLQRARAELEDIAALAATQGSIDWDAQDLGTPDDGETIHRTPAAADTNAAERRRDQRSFARSALLLAAIPAFGFWAFIALLIEVARRIAFGRSPNT
ncbi:MAG: hypothetical protein K2Q20_04620 [Phycisphaerales bacterium]|nr:hypothetical protein [Phycisphaerales bacterium]